MFHSGVANQRQPPPMYMQYFSASVPTEANYYIFIRGRGGGGILRVCAWVWGAIVSQNDPECMCVVWCILCVADVVVFCALLLLLWPLSLTAPSPRVRGKKAATSSVLPPTPLNACVRGFAGLLLVMPCLGQAVSHVSYFGQATAATIDINNRCF